MEVEERNKMEAEFIAKSLNLPKGSKLLDVGCGYARHAVYLAKMGYEVTCVDISDYLLNEAQKRIKQFNVEDKVRIIKMDMRKMDFKNEFDGVYIFYTTFGYFNDEENILVLRKMAQALKPNGKLLVDLANPIPLLVGAYNTSIIARGRTTRKIWWESGEYNVLEEIYIDLINARWIIKRTFLRKPSMEIVGERKAVVRLYMPYEIKQLISRENLIVLDIYGGYEGERYTASSRRLIIIAKKSE